MDIFEKNIIPFGGIEEKYSLYDSSKIVILPIPFDHTTTYLKGTDRGPEAMIEASLNMELYDIETGSEVYRQGIFTAPPIVERTSEEMLQQGYEHVKKYLNDGKFVVTFGGEHSISSAPIRAHAEKEGNISVLQLDAHTDLVPAYEGNPLSHASVMARVCEFPNVERVVPVGIRSMAACEREWVERENIFYAHEIHESNDWIERVLERLTDRVYITFDLDVFDSSLMPSTGTPESGGLFWHQVFSLLKQVAMKRTIIGFDIVELMPLDHLKAPDFLAAKAVYKLLSYTFSNLRRDDHDAPIHAKELQTL